MKRMILATIISALLVSGPTVFAEDQILNAPGTTTIQVTAKVVSTFEVNVPDVVEITERGIKEFQLTATGNISTAEYLDIEFPEIVTMTTEGKDPVDLALTCDMKEVNAAALAADGGAIVNCSVDASTITAGNWTGAVDVNITLEEVIPETP